MVAHMRQVSQDISIQWLLMDTKEKGQKEGGSVQLDDRTPLQNKSFGKQFCCMQSCKVTAAIVGKQLIWSWMNGWIDGLKTLP